MKEQRCSPALQGKKSWTETAKQYTATGLTYTQQGLEVVKNKVAGAVLGTRATPQATPPLGNQAMSHPQATSQLTQLHIRAQVQTQAIQGATTAVA